MTERTRLVIISAALFGFSLVWYALMGPTGLSESFALTPPPIDSGAAGVQPFYDLIRVPLRALPGHELQALWWTSLIFVSAAGVLTLLATYRGTGSLRSGTIASMILLFGIDGLWAASTIGPASLALFLTAASLAATTIERASVRHLFIAVLGGASLGLSPLLFVICAALWLGELRDYSNGSDETGTSGSLALPLSWLAVPFVVLLAIVATNPWIWDAPFGSGKTWLLDLLKYSPEQFTYLGDDYTSARPPLWLGLTVLLFETPLVILVLAGLPLFTKSLPARLRRNVFAVVLVSVSLPWVVRSSSWHGVPINALWAPALAILAGSSLEGIYERVEAESKRVRVAATVAAGLVVCGLAFESLAWRGAPAAYRNPLLGAEASMRIGEPILRSPSVSPAAITAVPASSTGRLGPLIHAYRRANLVASPESAPAGSLATAPTRFGREAAGAGPFAKIEKSYEVQGIPILWREE